MSYTEKASKSSSLPINGHLILGIKNGRLILCPVTNSDRETADLLSAIRDCIVAGDLWALTVEYL
jgi:hypothetical protein